MTQVKGFVSNKVPYGYRQFSRDFSDAIKQSFIDYNRQITNPRNPEYVRGYAKEIITYVYRELAVNTIKDANSKEFKDIFYNALTEGISGIDKVADEFNFLTDTKARSTFAGILVTKVVALANQFEPAAIIKLDKVKLEEIWNFEVSVNN